MRVQVNPDAEVGGSFEPVAAGTYRMKITECEQKMKEGGEFPYLQWILEHTDGDLKGVNGGSAGRVYEITTLKPDAQFRLRALVEAAGLDWADFDTEEVKGREVDVILILEDGTNGKPRNSVDKFIIPEGAEA